MDIFTGMVEEIRRQMEGRGGASGTRSTPTVDKKPTVKTDTKPAGSREGRSMQQVIAFSSPSFPA